MTLSVDELPPDDAPGTDLLADAHPRWWGISPAVTPRPWWAGWVPRRRDWATLFEPDRVDPVGPWRLIGVWLLGVPLLAFVGSFVLLAVCMNLRIEPVWSLMRWWERVVGEWAVLLPCAVPAAAAGGAWLLRRGRWEPAAKRAALLYAIAVGWLYLCGAASVAVLAELL